MTFLQRIQKPGGFWLYRQHGFRQCRCLATERIDFQGFCFEGFHPGIAYGDRFRTGRVIGNADPASDQRRLCLVLAALETDTGAFVNTAILMLEERFRNHGGIKEYERPAVPVPFLEGRNPFCWNGAAKAFIVFSNAIVGIFVVMAFKLDTHVM